MIVLKPAVIKFEKEKEISSIRNTASKMASKIGLDKLDCSQVNLAVSEIAGNTLKYAGKGFVTIRLSSNKKGLEIIFQDRGPGIKNVKKIMEEGYSSTAGSLGVGLNAAERAMDELSIKSKVGKGTTVVMRKYLPIPDEEIEYGVISLTDQGNTVNGDAYVVKEFEGNRVLLAVIDGTGNGPKASEVSNFVHGIIEQNYKSGLKTILTRCHKTLRKTFDVSSYMSCVMGLFLLKHRSLEYVGVGDTSIHVMGTQKKIHLLSRNGMVGDVRLPNLTSNRYSCARKIIIIMCSDGINPSFAEEDLPLDQSAQHIADFIMENYCREYGDATVLVAKRKR